MTQGRKPIPSTVRRAVLARANYCCENCGDEGRLEMHHVRYMTDGHSKYSQSIFGIETPNDLEALCRSCHLSRHIDPFGDFIRNPEECAAEWDYYNQDDWHL